MRDCVVAEIKQWRFTKHAVAAGVPVDFAFGFDGPDSAVGKEPGAPECKAGEKPKPKKELAEGEVGCVEKAARACAQGEKPLRPDQLGPGQLAKSNADQVKKIRLIIENLGGQIATASEARAMLGLKGGDRVTF